MLQELALEVLELALEPDGKSLRFATLSGSWFPSQPTGSKGKESFGVKGADKPARSRMVLKLDGSLKLMKHTLAVQATVVAKRCIEAPPTGSAKPVASAAASDH